MDPRPRDASPPPAAPGATFSLALGSPAELRELFAAPERVGASLVEEDLEQALALARDLAGAPRASLWLSGWPRAQGDLPLAARLVAKGSVEPGENGPLAVAPLRVALATSGTGPARPYGVVTAGPLPAERAGAEGAAAAERLARHVSTLLVERALGRRGTVDRVTGLQVRPAFDRRLPELTAAINRGEPVAIALVDLDGLREVNELRGRGAGDELLRGLGVAAGLALGDAAWACRSGADEVLLAMPGRDDAGARAVLASLREALEATCPGVHVSAGIALAPGSAPDAESLIFRADQALAHAQREGGGRDVVWSDALRGQRGQDRLAGVLTGAPARDYRNVRALLDAIEAVAHLAPLKETLARLLDRALDVTGAERGFVLLKRNGKLELECARGRGGVPLPSGAASFAASIAEEAMREGRAIERMKEGGAPISPSAETIGLEAALCAPLIGDDVPPGVVCVDSREPGRFDAATLALFDALAAAVATALRNATLYDKILDRNARLASDVKGREEELVRVRRLWALERRESAPEAVYEGLVGDSPPMRELVATLKSLEGTAVPVVIEGESGTGKELVARAVHARSSRREGPLVPVNCGAIPGTLFESELFGHARGSFTGAHADRPGLVEMAHGGTLFLDELGELPLEAQAKLLRFLESGEVRRVGEDSVRMVDVRVVAATNRDLKAEVSKGAFREDLFYRLAVFRLRVPALRDRPRDIPLLVSHILKGLGRKDAVLAPDAVAALVARRFPGNVRELKNVLERALALAGTGPIRAEHVVAEDAEKADDPSLLEMPLNDARAVFSLRYAKAAVERANGSVKDAATKAGVSKQTFYRAIADGEEVEKRQRGER